MLIELSGGTDLFRAIKWCKMTSVDRPLNERVDVLGAIKQYKNACAARSFTW